MKKEMVGDVERRRPSSDRKPEPRVKMAEISNSFVIRIQSPVATASCTSLVLPSVVEDENNLTFDVVVSLCIETFLMVLTVVMKRPAMAPMRMLFPYTREEI